MIDLLRIIFDFVLSFPCVKSKQNVFQNAFVKANYGRPEENFADWWPVSPDEYRQLGGTKAELKLSGVGSFMVFPRVWMPGFAQECVLFKKKASLDPSEMALDPHKLITYLTTVAYYGAY